jgi:DNA-binding transcriptional LysR family regulator
MSGPLADWDLIAAYLAVCRTGSLSGAARALGLAQPTVRRQVERLERELGPLFLRSAAGLVPTASGAALQRDAEAMESAAAAFRRAAASDAGGMEGTVRLTVSEMFGAEVLPGLLAPVLAAHPGLAVEVVADNRQGNLLRRDADIAVRFAPPGQEALVARRLRPIPLGLFAAPAYLDRRGTPAGPEDLGRHDVVGDDRGDRIARGLAALGWPVPARWVFRSDSDLAQLGAVRAGIGLGVVQAGVAARHGLLPALPDRVPMEAWALMHEDLRGLRRVRAVWEALVDALA